MKKSYLGSIQCIFQNVLLWGIKFNTSTKNKAFKMRKKEQIV